MNKATRLFVDLHTEYFPYYRSWCHDVPILITRERDEELHRVQRLLYQGVSFYAEHYDEYLDVIGYEEQVLRLLEYVRDMPFLAGTFRPDYVVRDDGSLLICEITSRFFGNGYFMSYFMEEAGAGFAREAHVTDRQSYFDDFFAYMAQMAEGHKKLVVLKSADKSDSIKLYVPFYEALGLDVAMYDACEVEANLSSFKGSLLISALNQKDLLSFSLDTLKRLADLGMRNDFRTIFLLHDKRLLNLLCDDRFLARFLTAEEVSFLKRHLIPTYLYGSETSQWEQAREHKDAFILKHRRLGKSEKVYAGSLMDENAWGELFDSPELSSMILQPFISQKVFHASWQGKPLSEYLSPSILCVDDRYFGTGLFRTSSCPVINQGDAHKMAPIVSDQIQQFSACHVL